MCNSVWVFLSLIVIIVTSVCLGVALFGEKKKINKYITSYQIPLCSYTQWGYMLYVEVAQILVSVPRFKTELEAVRAAKKMAKKLNIEYREN